MEFAPSFSLGLTQLPPISGNTPQTKIVQPREDVTHSKVVEKTDFHCEEEGFHENRSKEESEEGWKEVKSKKGKGSSSKTPVRKAAKKRSKKSIDVIIRPSLPKGLKYRSVSNDSHYGVTRSANCLNLRSFEIDVREENLKFKLFGVVMTWERLKSI